MHNPTRFSSFLSVRLLLLAITSAGLAVRLWGITVGLSQTFYVDEWGYLGGAFMAARLILPGQMVHFGSWNPLGWQMVLAVIYGMVYLLGRLSGRFGSIWEFRVYHWEDPATFILIGRVASALVSALIIPIVYDIGRRLFGRRTGLLAATLIAFSYPLVWFSHNNSNVSFVVFITSLALWAAIRIHQEGTIGAYVQGGLAIGYGIGTKYYPGIMIIPLLIAHLTSNRLNLTPWRRRLINVKLCAAGAAAIVAAVIANPIFIISPDKILFNLRFNSNWLLGGSPIYNLWQLLVGRFPYWDTVAAEPIPIYMATSLRILGDFTLLFCLVALVWASIRYRWETCILMSAPVVMYIMLGVSGGVGLGIRQLYFVIPPMVILCAAWVAEGLSKKVSTCHIWRLGAALVMLLLLFEQVSSVIRLDLVHSRPTTTEVARRWMLDHIPAGAVVAVEPHYGPFVDTRLSESDLETFQSGDPEAQAAISAIRKDQQPPFSIVLTETGTGPKSLAELREQEACFVVSADYLYERFTEEWRSFLGISPDVEPLPSYRAFYDFLNASTTLLQSFVPKEMGAAGPLIRVYRLRDDPACALIGEHVSPIDP